MKRTNKRTSSATVTILDVVTPEVVNLETVSPLETQPLDESKEERVARLLAELSEAGYVAPVAVKVERVSKHADLLPLLDEKFLAGMSPMQAYHAMVKDGHDVPGLRQQCQHRLRKLLAIHGAETHGFSVGSQRLTATADGSVSISIYAKPAKPAKVAKGLRGQFKASKSVETVAATPSHFRFAIGNDPRRENTKRYEVYEVAATVPLFTFGASVVPEKDLLEVIAEMDLFMSKPFEAVKSEASKATGLRQLALKSVAKLVKVSA